MELKLPGEAVSGTLPADWRVVPLGQLVAFVQYGSSAMSKSKGAVPVLRMGNLQEGRIDWRDLVYSDNTTEIQRYMLHDGDVLFNRTNTVDLVGKTALYDGSRPAIFAGYLIRVVTREDKLDPRYLNYFMSTEAARKHSAKVLSIAVGQANINSQKLKTYPIPLPPTLAEQRAIAAALGDVDALLDSLDKLIAKKRDIKQAAMQQLLTGQTRLPGFTKAWDQATLGDLFNFRNGVNADKHAYGRGVRFINVLEVITKSHLHAWDVPGRVSLPQSLIEAYQVRRGDVVFNRTSETQEEVALASVYLDAEAVVFGGFVIRGRPTGGRLDETYLGYSLRAQSVRQQLVAKGQGAIRANVGQSELRTVSVQLPELAEQKAIATVLWDMDADLAALEARREKTRAIRHGMMQELLTGRTRLL